MADDPDDIFWRKNMSNVPDDILSKISSRLPVTTPLYRFLQELKRMSDIPDDILPAIYDILPEILSRLPVTSLLRFRCVCKSWKGLIDSNQFINDHLNHSQKSNSDLNLNIIIKKDGFSRKSNSDEIERGFLYSEDLDFLTKRGWAFFSKLPHPFVSHETEILGSCDGLLVLSKGEDDIILWNPSIKRFKNIPAPGIEFPMHSPFYIVYGFGYDRLLDDYKLVRIVQSYGTSTAPSSEVKVYSVNRNSWKQIVDFPYYLRVRRGNGEFVNGALHWIVGTTTVMKSKDDNVDCLIAAFDLVTEEYRLVPLPKFASDNNFRIMNLGALGGCLTVVSDYYKAHHDDVDVVSDYYKAHHDDVDIWVMKEYGVEESWSLLFTLSPYEEGCYWDYSDVVMPIAYSNCGRKVLVGLGRGVLIWYDLDRKSCDEPVVEKYDVYCDQHFEVHTCLKSLVLLNNSICDCDFDIVTKNGEYGSSTLRNDFLCSWFGYDDDEDEEDEDEDEIY